MFVLSHPVLLLSVRFRLGRKVKNSQARTGHQRGMGGRGTDDDDTHEQHTDTNKLTRHTASVAATHPELAYT